MPNTHGGRRANSGRTPLPEEQKMIARLIDLPPEMWRALDTLATERKTRRNSLIREMLQKEIQDAKG